MFAARESRTRMAHSSIEMESHAFNAPFPYNIACPKVEVVQLLIITRGNGTRSIVDGK